jgi:hypothetical protein
MIDQINELTGGMVKMSIEKWNDSPAFSSEDVFYLMLNPEQYSEGFYIEYDSSNTADNREDPKVVLRSADSYTFDFILDGTGATGVRIDVDSKISQFKELVTEIDSEGKQNFLRIKWGPLQLKCVFNSASIQYTFFNKTGQPLRARLTVTFTKVHADQSKFLSTKETYSSKQLRDGQNIAQLASSVYGNARKLARLAQLNSLNSFRQIPTGTNLLFPPQSKL